MAREDVTIEELRTYSRDLSAAARTIDEAAERLQQHQLKSVLAHKRMIETDYLPRVAAFASDVLSAAIQTSLASPGTKTRIQKDMERAKQQADTKNSKRDSLTTKKKPAKS